MGGTRMGTNYNNSVVDKNLKVHSTKNLFITGSSVFATSGHDLRPVLRDSEGFETVSERFHTIWSERDDRYSELRAQPKSSTTIHLPRVEMSYIGG